MKKNILKIIIIIVIILLIIIGTMYLMDLDRMRKGEEVIFSTWGVKYTTALKADLNEYNSVSEKYSKTIDITESTTSSDNGAINLENNEHSFFGKIIESSTNYIIVEPNKNEEERKSSDKISIGLGEYNDAIYMVGTNVKITYDGTIMESYPAQVKATKIELKSVENFEILFYDKQPESDINVHKIVDKNETDKYEYDVYVYDGSVNIRIDGKDYSLKEALLENKITMEEIIAKANQDEKDGKIEAEMYKDGGSMEYHYANYTIIKCHTLDGNRDVYIGTKDLKLTDVI